MIMSLFTGLAGSASADDVISHEVKSGEILLKICEQHGLNYYSCKNAIMALNGFTSDAQLARLNVGQVIKLPASNAVAGTVSTTTATVTTTTVGGTTMTTTSYVAGAAAGGNVAFYLVPYTVKNGDTLNKICNELGSNYYYYSPVIQGINALANPNSIYAGQVLLIPTPSATGATSAVVSHVVRAGETMSSIANQYGLNYQAQRQLINGLNRRDNMDKIYVGQTVLLPGTAAAATGSVVTTAAAASTTPATANGSYQISISAADKGSPYAVVNNTQFATRANAGETVNIVPSPRAGYAVRDIQVIRTDSGTDIPVSNYAFTMPNSSVQVTVNYSRGLIINKVASPYGSFDAMVYGSNANTAFSGDEVTLAIYPKNGYNVKFTNGVYYQKSDLSMERVYIEKDEADGLYKFKMPNYEIRLVVDFEISSYLSLSSKVESGGGSGSVAFYVDGAKTGRAIQGQIVTMQMTPADGWEFDSSKYENSSGFQQLSANVNKLTKLNDRTYRFELGSTSIQAAWVTVSFINRNTYGLGADVRSGHGWISFQIVDAAGSVLQREVGRAQPDQLVEIVFHPDNEYVFSDFGFMQANSRGNWNGYQLDTWVSTSGRYIFKMPHQDVTIVTKYSPSKGVIYYDLNLNYDWNCGTVVAKEQGTNVPIARGAAAQSFVLDVSCKDNYRVSGIKHFWNGGEEWIAVPGDGKTFTVGPFSKRADWETFEVYFEEFREYTTIGTYLYRENTHLTALTSPRRVEFRDAPGAGAKIKVGDTFTFRAVATRSGFSVTEVWLMRNGGFVKMLSPIDEGGDTYRYTVATEDKSPSSIQFVAVQVGKEPQHYIIPEYNIADTGIVNVGTEELYYVSINGGANKPIGQVYGMGAQLAVNDADIKAKTNVKVKVTIPKKSHEFVGAGTILIYQVDTVSIRFSDYVLDNYKVLQDGTDVFEYEFWYNELTDLNIMVNFKEIGTKEIKADNPVAKKPISVNVGGQTVNLDDTGTGTVKVGSSTSTVAVTVTP